MKPPRLHSMFTAISLLAACAGGDDVSEPADKIGDPTGGGGGGGGGLPLAIAMTFDVAPPPVGEVAFSVAGGRTASLSTTGCSADLVVFNAAGAQVARGPGATTVTNTGLVPAVFRAALLRPYPGTAAPTICTLAKDGVMLADNLATGGTWIDLNQVAAGDTFETVMLPRGAGPSHAMYLERGTGKLARITTGGTGIGARAIAAAADAGERRIAIGVPAEPFGLAPIAGPMRLVRNDAARPGHDTDGDGLGDDLEAWIGTCSTLSATIVKDGATFSCSVLSDLADTDGDGIRDLWEVYGRRDLTPHQLLPAWGASPRHKDLFIELDYGKATPSDVPPKMPAAVARVARDDYSGATGVDEGAARRAQQAAALHNPDGVAGIALHLDTGVAATADADATAFGDWGGSNVVEPVADGAGGFKRADGHVVWKSQMAQVRRGIFRYMLGTPGGSGSNSNEFGGNVPVEGQPGFSHELGHGLGLGHTGQPADEPYAPQNCKPNYPSLMNYAYFQPGIGFSDGQSAPPIDNTMLDESSAALGFPVFAAALASTFGYDVNPATGQVDWNRDGFFAPAGHPVRAYANNHPGGACESAQVNQSKVSADQPAFAEPAIARLGDRIYALFQRDELQVGWTDSWVDGFDCAPNETPCGQWSITVAEPMQAEGGVDAVTMAWASPPGILVVTIDAEGRLWESMLRTTGTDPELTPPVQINAPGATGAPSLATMGNTVYLAYRGVDGHVHTNIRGSTGWFGDQIAHSDGLNPIGMTDRASPAIARAYTHSSVATFDQGIYGAFADTTGALGLYYLDQATSIWRRTEIAFDAPDVRGRPAMAWQPTDPSSDAIGTLHVMYMSGPERRGVQARTVMRVGAAVETFMTSLFRNSWFFTAGFDLLHDPMSGGNLRAVVAEAVTPAHELLFDPHADGIVGGAYHDANDWAVFDTWLCRHTATAGGLAPSPQVVCH